MTQTIPAQWMPAVKMKRVHAHWTGGSYTASSHDKDCYHFIWEGDGDLVRGNRSIADNVNVTGKDPDHYAAHTLGANTGAIGVSLACMGGAIESPFKAGKFPMTRIQFLAMAGGIAQLCKKYGIPVTDKTVLTHAEVQTNLGIKQKQKWDYTVLPFDPSVKGAKACGDRLRAEVKTFLARL